MGSKETQPRKGRRLEWGRGDRCRNWLLQGDACFKRSPCIWVASILVAIMNNAAVNMGVQVSVQAPAVSSLGCIHRNGLAGSCGNSVFNFSRSCQPVFRSGCTVLQSHQQCTRAPVPLHPPQLLFSVVSIIAVCGGIWLWF